MGSETHTVYGFRLTLEYEDETGRWQSLTVTPDREPTNVGEIRISYEVEPFNHWQRKLTERLKFAESERNYWLERYSVLIARSSTRSAHPDVNP